MRLTLIFLFLSQLALGQVVIDVQKETCEIGSGSITLVAIYHTNKLREQIILVEHREDTGRELMSVADYRPIWMPSGNGTYSFIAGNKDIETKCWPLDSLDHFTLDSGCSYSVNVLDEADSPYFCYVGSYFRLPVYFDVGKSDLRPDAIPIVDDLLKTLKKYPNISIEIGVHADERMPKSFSRCSTCSRAESIKAYLVEKGIAPERLRAKGYQGDKPFLKGAKTEDEHQWNRRTVITVTAVK